MNALIMIAVEQHGDPHLPPIKYAEADARALATALERHGFEAANRELLIDTQATKTAVESAVRRTLKKLTAADTLFVFYFGCGFACDGVNYVTCVDSRADDLEATSVALDAVFRQAEKSACGRVVFFLDLSRGRIVEAEEVREFESGRALCFTACRNDELSHVAADRRRGIWAFHLEQAIDGRDPAALQGQSMTVGSLQKYLQEATAQTLRKTEPGQSQTPQVFGKALETTVLLDFTAVFSQRQADQDPQLGQIKDSILVAETTRSIKSLGGFATSKKNTLPERCDSYGRNFVVQLANDELQEEVTRIRAALKRAFNFTRLQLSAENTGDGAATITTPSFNYNVSVSQHDSDPTSVVWRRSVDAITDPEQILSPRFETVFGDVFRMVQLSLHGETDLDEFVDSLEALGGDEIRVEYEEDKHVTNCALRFRGKTYEVRVTPKTFAVVHAHAQPPRQLLKSLFEVQTTLRDRLQRETLPFPTD